MPVATIAADVTAAIAAHVAASNPHSQYFLAANAGTAAGLNVGTSAGNVVQLDGSARLPAVDGSQLTGITATASPGGSDTQLQYNNAGVLAGASGITRTGSGVLQLSTRLVAPVWRPASDSTTALQIQTAGGTPVLTVDTTSKAMKIQHGNSLTYFGQYINTPGLWVNREPYNFYHFYVTHQTGHTSATLVVFENTTNTANGIEYRFLKTRAGSYDLTTGDIVCNLTFNTLSSLRAVANTTTITGGFRLIDFTWRSYNAAGVEAERMRLTAEGYLGINTNTPTALLDIAASTTSRASLRIRSGTAPTTPNDGDVWFNGTNFQVRVGGVTYNLDMTPA